MVKVVRRYVSNWSPLSSVREWDVSSFFSPAVSAIAALQARKCTFAAWSIGVRSVLRIREYSKPLVSRCHWRRIASARLSFSRIRFSALRPSAKYRHCTRMRSHFTWPTIAWSLSIQCYSREKMWLTWPKQHLMKLSTPTTKSTLRRSQLWNWKWWLKNTRANQINESEIIDAPLETSAKITLTWIPAQKTKVLIPNVYTYFVRIRIAIDWLKYIC